VAKANENNEDLYFVFDSTSDCILLQSKGSVSFLLTIISITSDKFKFEITFQYNDCQCEIYPEKTLPEAFANEVTKTVDEDNAKIPPKVWADFNCLHRAWLASLKLYQQGLLCKEDLPDEPKIEDYTDLLSDPNYCAKCCTEWWKRRQ
jgi:hypothetical protein